jgi:hypothetical protein
MLNDVLKPNEVQRQFRLKQCNIFSLPSLLHGCEILDIETKGCKKIIKTAEMKFTGRFTRQQKK